MHVFAHSQSSAGSRPPAYSMQLMHVPHAALFQPAAASSALCAAAKQQRRGNKLQRRHRFIWYVRAIAGKTGCPQLTATWFDRRVYLVHDNVVDSVLLRVLVVAEEDAEALWIKALKVLRYKHNTFGLSNQCNQGLQYAAGMSELCLPCPNDLHYPDTCFFILIKGLDTGASLLFL